MALNNSLAGFAEYLQEEERKSRIPKPAGAVQGQDTLPSERPKGDAGIENLSVGGEQGAAATAEKAIVDAFTQKYDPKAALSPGNTPTAVQYGTPMEAADFRGTAVEQPLRGAVSQKGADAIDEIADQAATKPVPASELDRGGDKPVEPNRWSWIDELQQESDRLKEVDESERRNETRRRYLAGFGDAISSIANLVYTTKDAPSQPQTYSSPLVNASIEKERARRKAEYDQINARLDAARSLEERLRSQEKVAELRGVGGGAGRYSPEYLDIRRGELELNRQREANKAAQKDREFEHKKEYDDAMMKIRQQTANTNTFKAQTARIAEERRAGKTPSASEIAALARSGYGQMLDEVAKNKFGVQRWEDIDPTTLSSEDRKMYRDLTTTNPNEQNGAINRYARNYAPDYMSQVEAAAGGSTNIGTNGGNSGNSTKESTESAPWLKTKTEDENKRPW